MSAFALMYTSVRTVGSTLSSNEVRANASLGSLEPPSLGRNSLHSVLGIPMANSDAK